MIFGLSGNIEIAVFGWGGAHIEADRAGLAAPVHILAARSGQSTARGALLEDDIDNARNGVSAVLGRSAIRQHFHPAH